MNKGADKSGKGEPATVRVRCTSFTGAPTPLIRPAPEERPHGGNLADRKGAQSDRIEGGGRDHGGGAPRHRGHRVRAGQAK